MRGHNPPPDSNIVDVNVIVDVVVDVDESGGWRLRPRARPRLRPRTINDGETNM